MMRLRYRMFAASIGTALCVAGSLSAQGSTPPVPDGYTQYWPGACVEGVTRGRNFYWRAREDTAEFTLARDTMVDDAKRIARDCARRFQTNAVQLAPYELIPYVRLLLAAGDDSGAVRASSQRLSAPDVRETDDRAWALAQLVEAYLDARPARVGQARVYLAQLDALKGSAAAVGKVRAQLSLAEYFRHVGDDTAMRVACDATIAAGRELSEHDRIEFSSYLVNAYRYLAEAEGDRTGDAAAPRAVIARARTDIGKIRHVDAMLNGYDSVFARYGTKAPRIVASRWIGAAGDTIHPAMGKLSLLNFQPYRWTIPATRRLARAAGDGADVAFVRGTIGYFRDLGPLSTDAEVRELTRYFTSDLIVPGPVAITETQYEILPDGRRVSQPTPNDRAYGTEHGATIVVVDRQGIIRRIWLYWDNDYEPRIAATLRRYQ